MEEVYKYCGKYRNKFDKLILETNATLLPTRGEVEAICSYKEDANIMISDYGNLSKAKKEFIQILEENKIPYIVKKYYGDDQHFDGWIDNTGRRNYGESDQVVWERYRNCPQMQLENMHCFRGELHSCPNSLFMSKLHLFIPDKSDYVDINSTGLSLEDKRETVRNFYASPAVACHYCMWKYAATMPRYPAAEQFI